MATWTYETVTPTPIENVLVERGFADGVHKIYRVSAVDGYVLHDNRRDVYEEYDDNGNPIGEPILGFAVGTVSCRYDYDFTAITPATVTFDGVTHNVNKVGAFEFYALPENSVPADQIFGGGNDTEVM